MELFSALLGKSLSGGGGSQPVLISKSISSNGTYDASDDNADGYSSVSVSVPNTYTAADEGKVVSNGALVAQGSDSVTENGTVDTTLISSLLVNVSGGSGQAVKLINPSSVTQNTSEISVIETDNYFFLFGRLYNSSSSGAAIFTFPDSFDVSKIGTFIKAARLREDINSADSIRDGIDAQNKTTSIYLYEGWNDYLAVYNKAT